MQISDRDLNLLSQIAYLAPSGSEDNSDQNLSLGKLIDYYLEKPDKLPDFKAQMPRDEWINTLILIKNDDRYNHLTNLTIRHFETDSKTGLVAYCFETPTGEPIVAFRGSESKVDWNDNAQTGFGGTPQQEAALEYLTKLKNDYGYSEFTVTGHSKGGNDAQFVTAMSLYVKRCVTFDAPGFSVSFRRENADKINAAKSKITSYEGKGDVASSTLVSIAGKRIIVDKPRPDSLWGKVTNMFNIGYNHKPNAFWDNNGNLYNVVNTKTILCNAVRFYTIAISIAIPDNFGKDFIDEVFNCFDGEFNLRDIVTLGKGLICLALLPLIVLAGIGEQLAGVWDDIKESAYELARRMRDKMTEIAEAIFDKLVALGHNVVKLKNIVFDNIHKFYNFLVNRAKDLVQRSTYVIEALSVNTAKLVYFSQRLTSIHRRVMVIDSRLSALYLRVGLSGLDNLIKADILTGYNRNLVTCIRYLEQAAQALDTAEHKLLTKANSF